MGNVKDENDKLKNGELPEDPTADAEEVSPDNVLEFPAKDGVPPRVSAEIASNKTLAAHWQNKGSPRPRGGNRPDKSRESYDFTVAVDLKPKFGRTDIAAALMNRPDGAVQAGNKGEDYVRELLAELFLDGVDDDDDEDVLDFEVTRSRMSDQDPRQYWLSIDGEEVHFENSRLVQNPQSFQLRVLDALGRMVTVPQSSLEPVWIENVNFWLASSEIVHLPRGTSTAFALKEDIVEALDGMTRGDTAGDLDRACTLKTGPQFAFKVKALLKTLNKDRDSKDCVTKSVVSAALTELRCYSPESPLYFLDDPETGKKKRVRVWLTPADNWPPDLYEDDVHPLPGGLPGQLLLPFPEPFPDAAPAPASTSEAV